eukprot:1718242-Prymnesium_polylepis.1
MPSAARDAPCAAGCGASRAPGKAARPAVQAMRSSQPSSCGAACVPPHESGSPFDEQPAPAPHASHQAHGLSCVAPCTASHRPGCVQPHTPDCGEVALPQPNRSSQASPACGA